GAEVARKAAALDMRVIGTKRDAAPMAHVDQVLGPDRTDQVLGESDFILLLLPSVPSTRGIIHKQALALMKPSAWLLNFGRGDLVVDADLVEAPASRRIAGAVLDAFREEPLPATSPLRTTANHVTVDSTWHGVGGCSLVAGVHGATILRYELLRGASAVGDTAVAAGVTSRLLNSPLLTLDETGEYLMRCDRVEFAAGGEALPHRHKGSGVRCLIAGELEVRIAARHGRVMKPGDAWFESGIEPVHVIASATTPPSLIRVSILPPAIRRQSPTVHVSPTR